MSGMDELIIDKDVAPGIMKDVDSDGPGILRSALNGKRSDDEIVSAFSYAISRFTGNGISSFAVLVDGRYVPMQVDCSDRSINDFVESVCSRLSIVRSIKDTPPEFSGFAVNSISSDIAERDDATDIFLSYVASDGCTEIELSYSDRHSKATMERFLHCFRSISDGLREKHFLSELAFTSEHDIAMMDNLNANVFEPRFNDFIDAFHRNVSMHPDDTFVSYSGRCLSYGESDRIADVLSCKLRSIGVKEGDTVAVYVPRSEWYVLSPLAIVKTGCAYMPIVESFPDERILFMLRDSGSSAVIVTRETRCRISEIAGIPILCIDDIDFSIVPERAERRYNPQQSGVILYTSGSTGEPKGTVISRHALTSFGEWYARRYNLTRKDRYGLYASFVFDAHLRSIFPVIIAGACVDIVPEDMRHDMVLLNEHFVRYGVTQTFLPTQVGKMFASVTRKTTLKVINMGGEMLGHVDMIDGCMIADSYGPTENTVVSAAIDVRGKCDISSVGPINEDCKAYILDREMRRVPYGAVGELYVSGYQLSSGYINRDEMNSTHFFPNPFSSEKGFERLYATNDFFRYLPDGTLGVLGRRDGQVKIRGNRVELVEVESTIRQMPHVTDVTVQAILSKSGDKRLCAYIVTNGVACSLSDVQSYVSKRKPDYMVPSFVVILDKIPLNVNGKVDRHALTIPDMSAERRNGRPPMNDGEREICSLFAKSLNIDTVYADDDYFSLGGTSLSSLGLLIDLIKVGHKVMYLDIFANPTPEKLASFIFTHKRGSSTFSVEDCDESLSLKRNILDNVHDLETVPLGDVLLTGATGFFGSHILHRLITMNKGKVYCVVRGSGSKPPKERLSDVYRFYFGEPLGDNVDVIEGDIADDRIAKKLSGIHIDTVINSAAVVSYYAPDDSIDRINHGGLCNMISVAMEHDAFLVHVSTVSVAGVSVNGSVPEGTLLTEDRLHIGQTVDSMYAVSKLRAEEEMLSALDTGAIRGMIFRAGNLTSRYSDGVMQADPDTNVFMNFLWSIFYLGCCSEDIFVAPIEFSPVDLSADALIRLATVRNGFTVYNGNNCDFLTIGDFVKALSRDGKDVKTIPRQEFEMLMKKHLDSNDLGVVALLRNLSSYDDGSRVIDDDNRRTVVILDKLGFRWPDIGDAYLDKFVAEWSRRNYFVWNKN